MSHDLEKAFCTVINCMDGRVQLPVLRYLQKRFQVEYVDSITEPGPNRILAEGSPSALVDSILARLRISLEKHHSVGIAVVGHHDCAGNPAPEARQREHLHKAVEFLRGCHPDTEVLGLWVDENWEVHELESRG
jgi:carbonic anhydrase